MGPGASSSRVPYTVFISHVGEDKTMIAMPLRNRLAERGISAFVDNVDMPPGTEAKLAMRYAMETAKIGVFVVSPEFVVKEWPIKELMCFFRRREECLRKGNDACTIPAIVPFFYRLSVDDLYHEPKLDRKDGNGVLLTEKSRFYERQQKGDVEANTIEIKEVLRKLHGITGVQNYVAANNDSSWVMDKRRNILLGQLCEDICRVNDALMQMERSREVEKRVGRDLHTAKEVCVSGKETASGIGVEGVKRDGGEGEKLDRAVIEVDEASAMFTRAQMLEHGGEGVQRDAVEAKKLYHRAIEAGNVDAICALARMLTIGAEGVKRNVVEAEKLYGQAVEAGRVDAMCALAAMLECGAEGIKKDAEKAKELYRRAIAETGDVNAVYHLAMMLHYEPNGEEAVAVEAEQLYHRAIDGGEVDAMYHLGRMLKDGAKGVERNPRKAKELFRRATDEEHVNATFEFAMMLGKRVEGMERDAEKAEELFRRASEKGHVGAMFELAMMLEHGDEGVERNAEEAEDLYRRAVDAGHINALKRLSDILETGAEAEKLQRLFDRATAGAGWG